MRLGRLIASVLRFAAEVSARVEELQKLFPYGLDAKAAIHEGQVALALEALAANLEKAELADAHAVRKEIEAIIDGRSLPYHAAVADFCTSLGDASVPPTELAEGWRQIREEAARLAALRSPRLRLDEIADQVRRSGAPTWAGKLATDPALDGQDPWTPADWGGSWDWRRADGFIEGLADRTAIERLSYERAELEAKQRMLLAEVVRRRLGVAERRTGSSGAGCGAALRSRPPPGTYDCDCEEPWT